MRISDWSSDVCSSDLATSPRWWYAASTRRSRPSPYSAKPCRNRRRRHLPSNHTFYFIANLRQPENQDMSDRKRTESGRASWWEGECPNMELSGDGVHLTKKQQEKREYERKETR